MKIHGFGQVIWIIFFLVFATHAKADMQDLKRLKTQVHDYITESIIDSTGDVETEVVVTSLDARLRLKTCDNPPELDITHGKVLDSKLIVTATCPSQQWQVRIPVQINRYDYALVASSTIKRGESIESHHLVPMKVKVSQLSRFFHSPKELEGYVAKTTIRQGKVLKPYMFKLPHLIKRGDQVQIKVDMPGLSIESSGIAMNHGVKNQTIQVKNLSSNKLIEATVVAPNTVKVEL